MIRPPLRSLLLAVACAGWLAPAAPAQALLELTDAPRPGFPSTWEVTELTAHADVTGQSASVRLSQTFKNVGSRPLEARLLFPVPPGAAVRELTLLVDGKELTGTLQKAGEARETYEAIVRRNRDPALLEYAGYGLYRTSVFPIPKGASRTVQRRYTQLLGTREGLVDLTLPVGSAGSNGVGAKKVEVSASVNADSPLKVVYSPTHAMEVERPTDKTATAKLSLENVSGREDVRLLFGTADGLVGLNVLTFRDPDAAGDEEEGEGRGRLLPAAGRPGGAEAGRRPAGPQRRAGDRHFRQHGRGEDGAGPQRRLLRRRPAAGGGHLQRDRLQQHGDELSPGDGGRRRRRPRGRAGVRRQPPQRRRDRHQRRPHQGAGDDPQGRQSADVLMFLTDGQPTSGVTDEQQIAENVAAANDATDDDGKVKARLFTFGVGYDVNARLLDRLSDGGRGVSAYVAPEEDVEASVSELYAKIAAPVLTDLALDFAFDASGPGRTALNRVLPADLPDLFAGQQLSVVGRYVSPTKNGKPHDLKGKVTLSGVSTAGDRTG